MADCFFMHYPVIRSSLIKFRLMKRSILFLGITMISVNSFAQEFWLNPQKYFYIIRETANIRFVTGGDYTGRNPADNKQQIAQLVYYTPSDSILNISNRIPANKGDSLPLPLHEDGTHMLILTSGNSITRQDAEKFNAALKENGLDDIIRYRKEHGEENTEGIEQYRQCAKTILQVNGKLTDACTLPTSLPLDIIPEENPYSIPNPSSDRKPVKLRFRVVFKGEALGNVLVKALYQLPGKEARMDSARTNRKGWVILERHPGPYLLRCMHMERAPKGDKADWQSYRGSLSFEYSQFFTRDGGR